MSTFSAVTMALTASDRFPSLKVDNKYEYVRRSPLLLNSSGQSHDTRNNRDHSPGVCELRRVFLPLGVQHLSHRIDQLDAVVLLRVVRRSDHQSDASALEIKLEIDLVCQKFRLKHFYM